MRQIDHMTSADLEVLTLKGMLVNHKPNTMTTHTVTVTLATKNPEKVHSRVFNADAAVVDPIIKSVYISRPQSNNHTKAKITVEFLD